ncbi:unnamed protein product (macronuclear) [Paramecium tetraurelia]|uniref:Peptidase M20 dimerisation domain-containing protein n=1 Tax=Paramecium tetraurelia TaxID=5888 RepID=A0DN51_PARTE|nr:uncharacterized protein GSPATT00018673001 [Paramecium tetraurelia]CAK84468.1 unnamed protein product [Paramecium tetraurelia]|eukprot:XP_001451865.1 hypothetical protein (macronuclear) [Paramecium tetraurelia strain d4-2]
MRNFIKQFTELSIVPSLSNFIRIPNLSPQFDNQWQQNQLLEEACNHIVKWIENEMVDIQKEIKILQIPNSPRCIAIKIFGNQEQNKTILCYGHYDKQPHFVGWKYGPTTPIIENNRLYGRGSADDGCVPYAIIAAIKALKQFKQNYHDCYLIVEGEEESGSHSLIQYIQMLKISKIDLMIAIDSGIVDYDRLWITNSMRGAITFDIKIFQSHNPFQYLRSLLNKLENSVTGEVNQQFQTIIPQTSFEECQTTAQLVPLEFPMTCLKMEPDHVQQYINRAWKPSVSYIGGLEDLNQDSDELTIRISMRLPPNKDAQEASGQLSELLTTQWSQIEIIQAKTGLAVKPFSRELKNVLNEASINNFGNEMRMFHEGASIPFLNSLHQLYPESEFLILGVLAPDSNAHGPNENLNIEYLNKLIGCLAYIFTSQHI